MAEKLNSLLSEKLCSIWDFWTIPYEFLGVRSCNADEFATFSGEVSLKLNINSEYVPLTCTFMGTPLTEIFMEGTLTVLLEAAAKESYCKIDNLQQREAVKSLLKFLENLEKGGNHLDCLRKLHRSVKGVKGDDADKEIKHIEAKIQAVLACHLFSPLLTEGEVIVDSTCYKSSTSNSSGSNLQAECPFCNEPLNPGNTNFGVPDLWHGRADIVVKMKETQQMVKVTVDKVESDKEEGHGEPASKRTELQRPEDSEEHMYWYCLAEVKPIFERKLNTFLNKKPYKQTISQTLLNSFLAVKNNRTLENVLIPSFLVCQNSVFINFYNARRDVLLVQSMPMKFFEGSDVNYAAFFSVWMALNMDIFPSEMDEAFYSTAGKSGFVDLLNEYGILKKYQDEIDCHFTRDKKSDEELPDKHSIAPEKREELIARFTRKKKGEKKL